MRAKSIIPGAVLAVVAVAHAAAPAEPERYNDDKLVASYRELVASGNLDTAIRNPVLPSDAPEATFLQALAWFAAGAPDQAGSVSLAQVDSFVGGQVQLYRTMLEAK